jgi:AAA domain/CHC2 zinc finger
MDEAIVAEARAVRIESEIARRGINNLSAGIIERCGPCPVCGEGTDRFAINVKKQVFNCRVCGKGGDVITLVELLDGCDFHTAVETLTGKKPSPFKPNGHTAKKTYSDYCDETGAIVYQVERTDYYHGSGKTFRQRRPDGNGGWLWNLDGIAPVPYRLPELIEALANGSLIVIAEGERKVDLLRGWNIPATCNSGGRGSVKNWAAHAGYFKPGDRVVVLPDADKPGQEHANAVAASLSERAASVRILDLPGLGPKGDIVDWAAAGGTAEKLHALIENDARPWAPGEPERAKSGVPPTLTARPYVWRDPKTIPPRQWLHGGHYIRGFLSATIGPGGLGKTSLQLVEAIGMVAGRDLLKGTTAPPLNVWYWNLEDPRDEIDRRIAAIVLHYRLDPASFKGRLFINSEEPLVIASMGRDGAVIAPQVVERLTSEISRLQIDALTVDPFVSSHKVPENDNGAIDTVAKAWSGIARTGNCAVEVAHHIRKPASGSNAEITVDDARGAGALKDAGRAVRVLNVMSKKEAEAVAIKPEHRRLYFHVDAGKANMKPPAENIDWRKIVSVPLDNGTDEAEGDWVGVVSKWKMPGALEGVTTSDLLRVQKRVSEGEWRENPRAKDWAGKAVAEALDLDLAEPAIKKRVAAMLKIWLGSGALKIVSGVAKDRHEKKFVKVGQWAV